MIKPWRTAPQTLPTGRRNEEVSRQMRLSEDIAISNLQSLEIPQNCLTTWVHLNRVGEQVPEDLAQTVKCQSQSYSHLQPIIKRPVFCRYPNYAPLSI
uniref:Uncharacterized protein n=1 Tax=Cyanothece sp. (strain PCC 7425 / ATCC 29141) TaxID=395961 RepID=B8HZB8_CYAP4